MPFSCVGSDFISSTCLTWVLFKTARTMTRRQISTDSGILEGQQNTLVQESGNPQQWDSLEAWGGRKCGEGGLNISPHVCLGKRDITRKVQLVQTFWSLLHVNFSRRKQQKNCSERYRATSQEEHHVHVKLSKSYKLLLYKQ